MAPEGAAGATREQRWRDERMRRALRPRVRQSLRRHLARTAKPTECTNCTEAHPPLPVARTRARPPSGGARFLLIRAPSGASVESMASARDDAAGAARSRRWARARHVRAARLHSRDAAHHADEGAAVAIARSPLAARPRGARPAPRPRRRSGGKPRSNGSLPVESRPMGAAVTINGNPAAPRR